MKPENTDASHKWNRLSSVTYKPARVLHRGSPLEGPARKDILRHAAYATDSFITAGGRLFVTPVVCAKNGARHFEEVGRPAVFGTITGFGYGLGKGLLGAGVSLSCGAFSAFSSVFNVPVAALSGIADGIKNLKKNKPTERLSR